MKVIATNAGTRHAIEHLDHREDRAVSPCGQTGEPVELDDELAESTDECGHCYADDD